MGQNKTSRRLRVLVHVSIYRGSPNGYPFLTHSLFVLDLSFFFLATDPKSLPGSRLPAGGPGPDASPGWVCLFKVGPPKMVICSIWLPFKTTRKWQTLPRMVMLLVGFPFLPTENGGPTQQKGTRHRAHRAPLISRSGGPLVRAGGWTGSWPREDSVWLAENRSGIKEEPSTG